MLLLLLLLLLLMLLMIVDVDQQSQMNQHPAISTCKTHNLQEQVWYCPGTATSNLYLYPSIPVTTLSRCYLYPCHALLSVCWPKMHDCIMSWPFIGLIYNIWELNSKGVSQKILEETRDKYNWQNHRPSSGDRSLAGYLSVPKIDGLLAEILQVAKGPVNKLIAAMRMVPANSSQGLQFMVGFYMKETFNPDETMNAEMGGKEAPSIISEC
jgi:hypothetical protein